MDLINASYNANYILVYFFKSLVASIPGVHISQYLSHEVSEEEHVTEEGRPPQQVTDAQITIVVWHADDGFHKRPKGHPFLDLQMHMNNSNTFFSQQDPSNDEIQKKKTSS